MLDLQANLKVYDVLVAVEREYQIKEVARVSGFSPSSLRYYEKIGLLQPARSRSGYRVYNDATIELLAFVARAKQLGCTLDEIRELAAAWRGGECGPVQDSLRRLVAEKLGVAQQQIAQLVTFTSELQHAARVLERHRPVGPCDDQCGCTTVVTNDDIVGQRVAFTQKPGSGGTSVPIACTLTASAMRSQLDEWQALFRHVTARTEIPGGIRLALDRDTPLH